MRMPAIYECYLCVDSQGQILADKRKRLDSPGHETWRCEYFDRFFQVTMVYPGITDTQIVKIADDYYEVLRTKFQKHARRKLQNARHEAGHAVLIYALRLSSVEAIDILPKAVLRGNLREQLRRGVATTFSFLGGTTYPLISERDEQRRDTLYALAGACQAYGGLAGSHGDETATEGDLKKSQFIVQDLLKNQEPMTSVLDRLKSLAFEIIADPIVASRHDELTKQLLEKGRLHQEQVEAILDPTTLPDFTNRLEAIRIEFRIPTHHGDVKSV